VRKEVPDAVKICQRAGLKVLSPLSLSLSLLIIFFFFFFILIVSNQKIAQYRTHIRFPE
jgi:hypothetical protein